MPACAAIGAEEIDLIVVTANDLKVISATYWTAECQFHAPACPSDVLRLTVALLSGMDGCPRCAATALVRRADTDSGRPTPSTDTNGWIEASLVMTGLNR